MSLDPVTYVTYEREYFDTIAPWKDIRRVAVAPNREVVGIHHPDNTNQWEDGSNVDWAEYENNGWNCMVEIPAFYYKAEMGELNGEKTYRWYISDGKSSGFKLHPAFIRNGVRKNYIYMSAFEGSLIGGKLRSLPNKSVQADRTIVEFRGDAQGNGVGWEQQDFLSTAAIQLLYLVEYGHFDSQTMIGEGRTDQGSYANTGMSLENGNQSYGDSQYMTYRGIENFFGNYYKWVDGINFRDRELFVADHNFESDKFDGHYESLGITLGNSDTYYSDIGFNEDFDYGGFLGTVTGGSSNSHLYDWQVNSYTGNKVGRFGGYRDQGAGAGFFYWSWSLSASESYAYHAARLALY